MDIIKEHNENHCVIRSNTYAKSLDYIFDLFGIAKSDFPELKPENVNVVQFAGRRYARTYGIEFEKIEGADVPSEYEQISQLENTF